MTLAVRAFHWCAALLTVPFGLIAAFVPNPEQVKVMKESARPHFPQWLVARASSLAHLTIISHESMAAYFLLALNRDHGFLALPDHELFYVAVLAVALFVAIVFWASCVLDPSLMIPVHVWFPPETPKATIRKVLFQSLFDPQSKEQKGFCHFMIYLHTLCPLLVVADIWFVDHGLQSWRAEAAAVLAYGCAYLLWNFFCWWLLRQAPYPLQAKVYGLGLPAASLIYAALVGLTLLLLQYSRLLRQGGHSAAALPAVALPLAAILWASVGLFPFKQQLARFQGASEKTA